MEYNWEHPKQQSWKKCYTSFVSRKQEADEYFMSLVMSVSPGRGGYFIDFSC